MPSETPNIDRCIDNYYALPEWQINAIRWAARDELAALREQVKQEAAEFKNFHRLLSERFGLQHDETDWRRDQLSHIEAIFEQVKQARNAALDEAAKVAYEMLNPASWDNMDKNASEAIATAILALKGP